MGLRPAVGVVVNLFALIVLASAPLSQAAHAASAASATSATSAGQAARVFQASPVFQAVELHAGERRSAAHSPHGAPARIPVAYVAEPSPDESLAGSRAGVGRTPPGRPLPVPGSDDPVFPSHPEAEPSESTPPNPRPERPAPAQQPTATGGTEPLVNVVPLGAGLLLTGLGIGFLALRLRR
ncbi:hypothetical protein OKJ48_02875 [Streptomyces kunmingensis]|uniref:Gram-positive cocci surface proteins LPxTG domain-containing protein n=1 Tax=Streptomyces kunmingensis TaxID=68225 RepID=A0ABU6C3A2_9ACTN|nr:hypothetical protein [Streptomyces kunmingensis]MEB3959204.1 hypothetical protein [Streptomyces kunmingensis]